MEQGTKGVAEAIVTNELSAKAMGSGTLPVLATPAMIALMEKAAHESVSAQLDEGKGTVGIYIEVSHLAPTPINERVHAESILISVEKRILTFEVSAYAGDTLIGQGIHKRAIIDSDKFMIKVKGDIG